MNKRSTIGLTTFFIDGGSRGNPGPSGYGVVVQNSRGETIASLSEFLGTQTNNFAEYSGLLAALEYAVHHHLTNVRIFSDSELLVRQMTGKYKVKSPDLRPLFERAQTLIAQIPQMEIEHVRRENNADADALANKAMDCGESGAARPQTLRFDAVVNDGRIRPLSKIQLPENTLVECFLRIKH